MMTVSSREIRAGLLAMGYHEADVSELDVRVILRRLLQIALKG